MLTYESEIAANTRTAASVPEVLLAVVVVDSGVYGVVEGVV